MPRKTYEDPLHSHPDFSPLFSVLRTELGRDWRIYNEFLEDYRDASIAGEKNLTPWANQMEPLIQSQAARFAHQGVLFLLKDMYSRLNPKDKRGATSIAPSLDADESCLQKS